MSTLSPPSAAELAILRSALPANEPVRSYAPGSAARREIEAALSGLRAERREMPLVIGGLRVRTGRLEPAIVPHDHRRVLGEAHMAGTAEVERAIAAALEARRLWSRWPWQDRAAVFAKAAELLAGPWRARLNAATMLGQSKTVHQAEIDAAAELIDFWRFNIAFMQRLAEEQPISPAGAWNRVDYRPLEGFVFAVTPFNFTAIAGNLPTAPALMGNAVVWKPAATAKLAAALVMEILIEAGLPPGVINLVYGDPAEVARACLAHPALAGVHFTGSTAVFNGILRSVGQGIDRYATYPRLVGETGGKNFVLLHASADVAAATAAIVRGAFEYQGQKCSAASRLFVPRSLWGALRQRLCDEIASIKVGDVADFRNFMGAVIDKRAWQRHVDAIAAARSAATVLAGGNASSEIGYFVEPTLIQADDLGSPLLQEELFGPIATAFVYEDGAFAALIDAIDGGGRYGLTGAIFAQDRAAIRAACDGLRDAAGNFYINDKPTGAVVGQQPFGGARASGTNDKAGSMWNLIRWSSPRAIKETFDPPRDYRYPFLGDAA